MFFFNCGTSSADIMISKNSAHNEHSFSDPAEYCQQAIRLAVQCLKDGNINIDEYTIIRADNLIVKGQFYEGPEFWNITFKKKSLIPIDKNGMIGAGGEIFVKANLAGKTAMITGYGE
jgi:hypothetical protein